MTAVLEFVETTVPRDSVPPAIDIEYPCEICGAESGPYSGRGRKPKKCSTHRVARATADESGGERTTRRTANTKLAEIATAKLVQLNGFAALGALLLGFPHTAGAFAASEDTFRAYVMTALESDEKLCRTIIKTGGASSGLALFVAYGSLAANVAPVAVAEWREKRAEARRDIDGEVAE
jgi:hypothetical protein